LHDHSEKSRVLQEQTEDLNARVGQRSDSVEQNEDQGCSCTPLSAVPKGGTTHATGVMGRDPRSSSSVCIVFMSFFHLPCTLAFAVGQATYYHYPWPATRVPPRHPALLYPLPHPTTGPAPAQPPSNPPTSRTPAQMNTQPQTLKTRYQRAHYAPTHPNP
jgi:hypothetical protein